MHRVFSGKMCYNQGKFAKMKIDENGVNIDEAIGRFEKLIK